MPIKKVKNSTEEGNLMLMTLMVLLVLSVLGTTVLRVAGMENKVSRYGVQLLQAQQAADAGVDWAIEEIWKQGLPEIFAEQVVWEDDISSQIIVSERVVEALTDSGSENDSGNGNGYNGKQGNDNGNKNQAEAFECSYQFTSAGVCRGTTKEVAAEVVYTYTATDPASYDRVEIRSYTTDW